MELKDYTITFKTRDGATMTDFVQAYDSSEAKANWIADYPTTTFIRIQKGMIF